MSDDGFEALLLHIKEQRGFDFTGYKRASLARRVRRRMEAWRALGATHLAVDTMRAGFASPKAHIEAIRSFREVLS